MTAKATKQKTDVKKSSSKKPVAKTVTMVKRAKKTGREPRTMEELLKTTGYKLPVLKKGEIIEGQIVSISGREILIDVGSKTVGVVGNKEWSEIADFVKTLQVGDKVKVYIISPESEAGQIILSLRHAAWNWRWDRLDEYRQKETVVEVRGVELNKGGLVVNFEGMRGFIPGSQLSSKWLTAMQTLINRLLKVKVLELDRKQNRLVFSERAVGEVEEGRAKNELMKKIKTDKVYQGVVSGIVNYGLFVSIKKEAILNSQEQKKMGQFTLDGLVHISEVAWEKVTDLANLYRIGDTVSVKVLGVEKKTGKLNLSIKATLKDPWDEVEKRFKKGKLISGQVSRVSSYGVLVQLDGGIEGLIHITHIPPSRQFKVGEQIKCTVDEVNKEKRRVSLLPVLKAKPVMYR